MAKAREEARKRRLLQERQEAIAACNSMSKIHKAERHMQEGSKEEADARYAVMSFDWKIPSLDGTYFEIKPPGWTMEAPLVYNNYNEVIHDYSFGDWKLRRNRPYEH